MDIQSLYKNILISSVLLSFLDYKIYFRDFRIKMPIHQCDTCGRNYSLKRNLKRHVSEKHSKDYEHWNCVEPDCAKTFIRRTTLTHHLRTVHGYTPIRAGEFSLRALRGDTQANNYYEDISDDDSIFDVINDIQEMRNVGGDGDIPQDVIDLHVDYHQDEIALNCDGGEKDDSIEDGKLVTTDNEESVSLSDGEGRKISVVVCDVHNDGMISDDDIRVDNELVMHDEVVLDCGDADLDGEVNCAIDSPNAANISDNVLNSEDAVSFDGGAIDSVDEAAVSEAQEDESDSQDGFETGDDWEIDSSEHDNSDENGLSDDDGDDGADDGEDAILISSGDEMAVERSEVKTKTQTLVFTFRRKSQYSNGQLISQAVSMEKDYYEHDY